MENQKTTEWLAVEIQPVKCFRNGSRQVEVADD